VVAVVAFHLGLTTGGYLGVDLFFTLSGFLITSLLVAEWQARGRIALGAFWVRRARRLVPAMLLVLTAVAIATRTWSSNTTFDAVRRDTLATLAYVANWRSVAAGTDYWALNGRPSPLEHTWSLAIEEQFYVVWPLGAVGLLVWWGRRRAASGADPATGATTGAPAPATVRAGLDRMLAVTVGAAVLSAAVALVTYGGAGDANRIYFGTDTRAAAILLGAALALGTARFGTVRSRSARVALEAGGGVALIGLAWAWLHLPGTDDRLYRGGLLLCGLAAVVVLAAATHPRPGPLAHALAFAPLRWLGLISYGLYLWHWPVIVFFTPGRTGWYDHGLVLARIGLSLALAVASYLLLERPIRHGLGQGWTIRLATPASVAVVLAVLAWSTQGAVPPVGERGGGRNVLRVADTPVPPVTPGRPRLLVVGDSGAWELRGPLGVVARARGVDWVSRGTPACGVLPGDGRTKLADGRVLADPPGCADWPARWAGHVAEVRPTTSFLFSVAPGGSARWVEDRWRRDCDPAYDAAAQATYERAIEVLGADGGSVAIATIAYLDSESDADGRYPEVDCRNRTIERAAASAGATLVDVAGWACERRGRCRTTVPTLDGDDVVLREDGLHYAGPGGVVATRWMLDRMGLTSDA
jgi:peptidoglycan/LPS O-acetylase OafA/YrhL